MKSNIRRTGDTALSELAKTYELVRDELSGRMGDLAGRLDDVDARRLGRRAYGSARDLRAHVEGMVRPAPARRRGLPIGLVLAGVATLGLAWLLYDRKRRDMIQGRITQLGVRTQEQMPAVRSGVTGAVDSVMGRMRRVQGGTGRSEGELRSEVEAAIAGAGAGAVPEGLQVAVEGRTVYLRGTVEASVADQVAARAQEVDDVAAVINLTTSPRNGSDPRPAAPRAGSA